MTCSGKISARSPVIHRASLFENDYSFIRVLEDAAATDWSSNFSVSKGYLFVTAPYPFGFRRSQTVTANQNMKGLRCLFSCVPFTRSSHDLFGQFERVLVHPMNRAYVRSARIEDFLL
jgi:hypothetical protein